jgi:hypothetical protein
MRADRAANGPGDFSSANFNPAHCNGANFNGANTSALVRCEQCAMVPTIDRRGCVGSSSRSASAMPTHSDPDGADAVSAPASSAQPRCAVCNRTMRAAA